MINIAVFISGRGSNFKSLHDNIKSGLISGCRIAAVFSNNPDAKGLDYAKENDMDTIVIPSKNRTDKAGYDREILERLSPYNIDLICLAGYMRMVTNELIKAFPNRIINIHPSLLPSFSGLNAQEQAINKGVKISGCTLHFVDEGMDTGPIIAQAAVPVMENDTADTLSARILQEEHRIYSQGVRLFCEGRLRVESGRVVITGGKADG